MPRVKTGPTRHAKHKKVFEAAKGFRMTRRKLIRQAKDAVLHAGQYAFDGRKKRKQDFRTLWIQRINGGLKSINGAPSYSVFIKLLSQKKIELNRKVLATIASEHTSVFEKLVREVSAK